MRLLAVLLAVGCTAVPRAFRCGEASQCVRAGAQGSCEATGWCSFPDGACASGRRYATLVGDGLADQCLDGDMMAPPLGGCVQAIALGDAHGCALRSDGTAVCWGKNDHGQLGNGATGDAAAAVAVLDNQGAPLGGLSAIVAGAAHTCAAKGGTIVCWGDDSAGQLGRGGSSAVNPVPMPAALSAIAAIAAGAHHTCAALSNGAVWCWGANDAGQLGTPPPMGSSMPVEVVRAGQALDATALAAGATHSCAIARDKTLECWGSDVDGELGDGTTAPSSAPVTAMALGAHVTEAAGGAHYGCALGDDARVSCFGLDDRGQAGGSSATVAVPTALAIDQVTAIAAGATRACARRANGQLLCWGDGAAPAQLLDGVGAIAAGTTDVCAARANGIACLAFGDPRLACN